MVVFRTARVVCFALVALVLTAFGASAQAPQPVQDPESAASAATMRWGPLAMKSQIALSNLGVDTNVFNDPAATRRPSDFTLTFTPTTNLWLRMGRTWLDGTIAVDWNYFNRYASQRGANSLYRLGVTRSFNRLRLAANAQRDSKRDRPGLEIDARSQRFERAMLGEASMRVFGKTSIGARLRHREITFDKDAVFLGTLLAQELNQEITSQSVFVRHNWTPLTTVTIEGGIEEDRFFKPIRNADSTRIIATVDLQPSALLSGYAQVGYRHYSPHNATVPPYRGLTALTNLMYRARATTRVGVNVGRDVQHSFDTVQPYYIATTTTFYVQQQVFGPFDVLARVGTFRMAYRDLIGAVVQISNRVDRGRMYGAGMGYRLGSDKRVGFTLDYAERLSGVELRRYQGLRYGLSVTYDR